MKDKIEFKSLNEWEWEEKRFAASNPELYWFQQKIYYPLIRWWNKVKEIPSEIKWFFQRGKRGWSDCDGWNAFDYNLEVMSGMLMRLSQKRLGHPPAISQRKWQILLKTNALRCSIIKSNMENFKGKEAQRELKKLLRFFEKYYFDLWD